MTSTGCDPGAVIATSLEARMFPPSWEVGTITLMGSTGRMLLRSCTGSPLNRAPAAHDPPGARLVLAPAGFRLIPREAGKLRPAGRVAAIVSARPVARAADVVGDGLIVVPADAGAGH